MASLPRVEEVLRKTHESLERPEDIRDIEYMVDVDPSGSESLVVFMTLKDGVTTKPATLRGLEATFRRALEKVCGFWVYFRWRTDKENAESVTTRSGLLSRPRSALKRKGSSAR
jgi:hypothetical protein